MVLIPETDSGSPWDSPLLTIPWTLIGDGGRGRKGGCSQQPARRGPSSKALKEEWLCASQPAKLLLPHGRPAGLGAKGFPQRGDHITTD